MKNYEMDLVQDWKNILYEDIRKEDLVGENETLTENTIIKYFTYSRKKGPRQPLKVFKSKELSSSMEFKSAISAIEDIFKSGGDISPYLSKDVDRFNDDLLFNDWAVLHLHLGSKMEKNNKYIERTGPLLFVYFKDDNVYFINIYPHKQWTNRNILQTLYNNWPELIEPYIMQGVVLAYEYTEEQHYKLRKNGITTPVPLKDKQGNTFYIIAPGLGITASGDSVNDVRCYQSTVQKIRQCEEMVIKEIPMLEEELIKSGYNIPNKYQFELLYNNPYWLVREKNTNLTIKSFS